GKNKRATLTLWRKNAKKNEARFNEHVAATASEKAAVADALQALDELEAHYNSKDEELRNEAPLSRTKNDASLPRPTFQVATSSRAEILFVVKMSSKKSDCKEKLADFCREEGFLEEVTSDETPGRPSSSNEFRLRPSEEIEKLNKFTDARKRVVRAQYRLKTLDPTSGELTGTAKDEIKRHTQILQEATEKRKAKANLKKRNKNPKPKKKPAVVLKGYPEAAPGATSEDDAEKARKENIRRVMRFLLKEEDGGWERRFWDSKRTSEEMKVLRDFCMELETKESGRRSEHLNKVRKTTDFSADIRK
ncbi:unnamed protein product, partial [Amoebophrya sp. A120]